MTTSVRLLLATCLAGLVLTGCGSAPMPHAVGARALGPMAAMGEAEKKLDGKLFADMEARAKSSRRSDLIEVQARKKGIRAEITAKKGEIDQVTINRRDLVKKGEVIASNERSWIMETEASKKEQRKQTILKALGLLADGLAKAEVDQDQAEDVKKVAQALEAYVKAQSGEKKKEAAN